MRQYTVRPVLMDCLLGNKKMFDSRIYIKTCGVWCCINRQVDPLVKASCVMDHLSLATITTLFQRVVVKDRFDYSKKPNAQKSYFTVRFALEFHQAK